MSCKIQTFFSPLYYSLFYVFTLSIFPNISEAQNLHAKKNKRPIASSKSFENYQMMTFIENKGQYPDSILYSCNLSNGGILYFMKNGYIVTHTEQPRHFHNGIPDKKIYDNPLKGHTYLAYFENASDSVTVEAQKKLPFKNTYIYSKNKTYTNTDKPIHAGISKAILYKNLYKGIDVRFFIQNGHLKYNIIIAPYTDINQYKLKYVGLDNLQVNSKKLTLTTSLATIEEKIPEAYQLDSAGEKTYINIKYRYDKTRENIYFKADEIDSTQQLIIDPLLVFASFSGATVDNWGFTASYSKDGSLYLAGIVFTSGFNGTPGAFKPVLQNSNKISKYNSTYPPPDILLMKLSSDGTQLLFATYIGGSGDELPHSIIEDNNGQIILLGRTNSYNDFPNPGGSLSKYGPGGGDFDILLTKLTNDGRNIVKTWIIGGTELDGANITGYYANRDNGAVELFNFYGDDSRGEVNIDHNNTIYIGSQTQSKDFPVTANAFQNTFGGQQDAVLLKISPDMNTILFSSFLGGNRSDAAFVVSVSPHNGKIYIAGSTNSNNLPGTSSGVLHPNARGGNDGFTSIINGTSFTLERTTYIGTNQDDGVYGLRIDPQGFVYLTGITFGTWPVINAQYQDEGGKQFIGKLKPDLSDWIYTTRFGTNSAGPNISPIAFAIDRCEHVYVSGFGFTPGKFRNIGTRSMRITEDALQKQTDNSDFYFAVFDKNATKLLYATYYGILNDGFADHVDGGTSRYDPTGVIYQAVCGACGFITKQYPTTSGAWAMTKGTGSNSGCNMLGIKLDFQLSGTTANLQTSIYGQTNRTIGCATVEVDFEDIAHTAKEYKWDFGDGSVSQISTSPTNKHIYTKTGIYDAKLIAIDTNSCNQTDTSVRKITVASNAIVIDFSIGLKVDCANLAYIFYNHSYANPNNTQAIDINNVIFEWDFGDGTKQTTQGLLPVQHTFPDIGPYTITVRVLSEFVCNNSLPVSKNVRIASNIKANFTIPAETLCIGNEIIFQNTSTGGETFTWTVDGKDVTRTENLKYTFNTPGKHTINLHGFDKNTCNLQDNITFTIFVSTPATPLFSYTYANAQKQENPRFFNESENATHFIWDFGDGTSIQTENQDTVLFHLYEKNGTYKVCLSAYNHENCTKTYCQNLKVNVNPYIKAPTAFTPNGDGINDIFLPIVQNADIYELNIYNRWGQHIFKTTDRNEGWDGRINRQGPIQAVDMYFYTISIRTYDGQFIESKGNIYLLR